MQFPKELRPRHRTEAPLRVEASMKCSSRRNCDPTSRGGGRRRARLNEVQFPKELRRSKPRPPPQPRRSLNEVQFPKELRPQDEGDGYGDEHASMKCSSRRNCDGA